MAKYLIYVGEGRKFDRSLTEGAIAAIEGVSGCRSGNFIGAIFECVYASRDGHESIVRISKTEETVTIDGPEPDALRFALEIQKRYPKPLWIVDMGYNFNLEIGKYSTVSDLTTAISSA